VKDFIRLTKKLKNQNLQKQFLIQKD